MSTATGYVQEWVDCGTDRIGLHRYPEPEPTATGAADAAAPPETAGAAGPSDTTSPTDTANPADTAGAAGPSRAAGPGIAGATVGAAGPGTAGAAGAPVAVVWPAMGVPARYYRPFAGQLRAAGFAVTVVDLRGTGTSTPRPGRASRYGYGELVNDVGRVLDALKPGTDGRRLLLVGHSLGGQACALHLALTQDSTVDGLALVAVGLPYWRDYSGSWGRTVLPYTQGINAISTLLGVWPGWGFGGRQARGVIRDWAYTARTGRFPAIDGVDVDSALGEVHTPMLAVSVEHDQYTPPSTLDRLCGKLTAAPVEREHYTVAQAGGPLDHFTWVRSAGPLATRIAAFAAHTRRPAA